MLRRATAIAVLAGIGAFLFSNYAAQDDRFLLQHTRGRNNTVLFMTDEHPGFCNVHLATAYSLLENHPEVEIHYASFPKLGKKLEQISSLAAQHGAEGKEVKFYPLSGVGYAGTIEKLMGRQDGMLHPPGLTAARWLSQGFKHFLAPWPVEEYWMLYQSLSQLIEEVDPAVVVIDTFFSPGIDATRDKRRVHALVTPNLLSDLLPAAQPPWTLFWKYPALGSGIPYPVPWKLVPANIYMNVQIIRGMLNLPDISAKKKALKAKGIKRPIDIMGLYRPDVPWLTQTLPGAHMPLVKMPQNVTLTGPINLAGVEVKDAAAQELLGWLNKPTVLIALGSGFKYTEHQTRMMLGAMQGVLKETDLQVLWKMDKVEPFDDEFLTTAVRESSGRLRIEKWLGVGPPTLAQNEHVVAFIHHGGAGCFHDALAGGVPQVILPLWADLYDIAVVSEGLGVGVWACQDISPKWNSDCIQQALLKVIKDSPESPSMAQVAASFAERSKISLGRDVAAQQIAQLAASGHS